MSSAVWKFDTTPIEGATFLQRCHLQDDREARMARATLPCATMAHATMALAALAPPPLDLALEDARIERAVILELISEPVAAELKRVVRLYGKPAAQVMGMRAEPVQGPEHQAWWDRLLAVLAEDPYADDL